MNTTLTSPAQEWLSANLARAYPCLEEAKADAPATLAIEDAFERVVDALRGYDVALQLAGKMECRSCGSTMSRPELDALDALNCCPERLMNEVIERDYGTPALQLALGK